MHGGEGLEYSERAMIKVRLQALLQDLYGTAFQDFFVRVMCAGHPHFLDIRTHGSLGDQGADGLDTSLRKLYACYGPQVCDVGKLAAKFANDLQSATKKRPGEFDTFVFVHNDLRGMHPEVATLIANASKDHHPILFEQMGIRQFFLELCRLDRSDIEAILGPLYVEPVVYRIELDDLRPLLDYLRDKRVRAVPTTTISDVSRTKLDYNHLDIDSQQDLLEGLQYAHLVKEFYLGITDVTERDEVAAAFNQYYVDVRRKYSDINAVMWQLQLYVLGNQARPNNEVRAAWVVLAHFFEHCDILEHPPAGAMDQSGAAASS
jgi:hypothetical protein